MNCNNLLHSDFYEKEEGDRITRVEERGRKIKCPSLKRVQLVKGNRTIVCRESRHDTCTQYLAVVIC